MLSRSKVKGVLVAVLVLLVVGVGGYMAGIAIGKNQVVESDLSEKLSDAFLSETIMRTFDASRALARQDQEKIKNTLMLQLADTTRFYAAKLGKRPAQKAALPVCAALTELRALAGTASDDYVRNSVQESAVIIGKHCDLNSEKQKN